jgi:hypothetical protein
VTSGGSDKDRRRDEVLAFFSLLSSQISFVQNAKNVEEQELALKGFSE